MTATTAAKKVVKSGENNIDRELRLIAGRHNGLLRPENVVEYARDPDTALNGMFTWDDGEAARQYRIHQARNIIRVRVRFIEKAEVRTKAYVSLTPDRKRHGGGYRAMMKVMSNAQWRKQLLEDARAELKVFRSKYNRLTELAGVFGEIDKVLK